MFLSPKVAHKTFGTDYIGHFKCGSCRYVVRLISEYTYVLCKEYRSGNNLVSLMLDDLIMASCHTQALEAAEDFLRSEKVGIHRTIALGSAEPLN